MMIECLVCGTFRRPWDIHRHRLVAQAAFSSRCVLVLYRRVW